ncbi:hypothetical protein Dimus_014518 [Dionaea muscipula]
MAVLEAASLSQLAALKATSLRQLVVLEAASLSWPPMSQELTLAKDSCTSGAVKQLLVCVVAAKACSHVLAARVGEGRWPRAGRKPTGRASLVCGHMAVRAWPRDSELQWQLASGS